MKKNILVVDDEENIVEVVRLALESEGYQVQACLDGSNLPDIQGDLPDLILLDVLLMGQDGREICKRLKLNKRTSHIPVIMLSAHSDAGRVAEAGGADDFLEKPFDVDVLLEKVGKALS